MYNNKISVYICSALLFGYSFLSVHAAEFRLVPSATSSIGVGDSVRIDVDLFPEGKDVNALEGSLSFSHDVFNFEKITDGNSPVALWLERPAENSSSEIFLSGIIPSGFSGVSAPLFSLYFKALKQGSGAFTFSRVRLLENDGKGTEVPTRFGVTDVIVSSATSTGAEPFPEDSFPPEQFTPSISSDPTVFDGKLFIIFSTTDKGLGVDHYDVEEVASRGDIDSASWIPAQSPYLLKDQALSSDIYVRAVDRAGNFIVEKVPARVPTAPESKNKNIFPGVLLLIVGLLFVIIIFRLLWKRLRS